MDDARSDQKWGLKSQNLQKPGQDQDHDARKVYEIICMNRKLVPITDDIWLAFDDGKAEQIGLAGRAQHVPSIIIKWLVSSDRNRQKMDDDATKIIHQHTWASRTANSFHKDKVRIRNTSGQDMRSGGRGRKTRQNVNFVKRRLR